MLKLEGERGRGEIIYLVSQVKKKNIKKQLECLWNVDCEGERGWLGGFKDGEKRIYIGILI